MKGPSLQRQYDNIQEQVEKKVEQYKEDCKLHTRNFPDINAMMIESFQKFDVLESDYLYDPKYPVGMGPGVSIRHSRWEFYRLDEEKFKICKTMDPKDLKCRECRNCGLFDIDGHYSIPCFNIMKISYDY